MNQKQIVVLVSGGVRAEPGSFANASAIRTDSYGKLDAERKTAAAGELRADTDVEIALLALTGTVLAKEKAADGSLNGEFAARIVDELLLGLAAR